MSVLNFPEFPSLGETYTFNERSWLWNGRAWESYPTTFTTPVGGVLVIESVEYTTASLAANALEDFSVPFGAVSNLLSAYSSHPAWIRLYRTAADRTADTRTSPGGSLPGPVEGLNAELVTDTTPETIWLSPVPTMQGDSSLVYARVKNLDVVSQALNVQFSIIKLAN